MPSHSVQIDQYLKQPERVVYALMDSRQVERLAPHLFRLSIRPIKFMTLKLQPVTDLKVWSTEERLHLASVDCYLAEQPTLSRRFSMELEGHLHPVMTGTGIQLMGQANLQVSVDLPAAFKLTPKAVLETTGNGLLNGVLLGLKQRLLKQLVQDYSTWATQEQVLAEAVPFR